MKINFVVILGNLDDKTVEVKHICCYENKPSNHDLQSLVNEVLTDPTFGMVDDKNFNIYTFDKNIPEDKEFLKFLDLNFDEMPKDTT